MHLNKSEFFITFIFENFAKKCYFMILMIMELNAIDKSGGPFNYKSFQTIFLIEVSIHVLLHGFSSHSRILAFLIKLYFLRVHVLNGVFKLFESQSPLLDNANTLHPIFHWLVAWRFLDGS